MDQVKRIIERNDTPLGKAFDLTIQGLIILSLLTFSIETLPGLSANAERFLQFTEAGIVAIFTVEYVLRLWVADKKFSFVFSFYGLIDLLSILPFYIATGIDLRSIRAFRLLRLFQILKIVRYNRAVRRFHRALVIAHEDMVLYLFVTSLLLYLASVGIYFFERDAQPEQFASVFHSMWWAVITLTTVGYGDVYPITAGGRIFTFFLLLIGLGVVSVPAGLVASAFSKAREMED